VRTVERRPRLDWTPRSARLLTGCACRPHAKNALSPSVNPTLALVENPLACRVQYYYSVFYSSYCIAASRSPHTSSTRTADATIENIRRRQINRPDQRPRRRVRRSSNARCRRTADLRRQSVEVRPVARGSVFDLNKGHIPRQAGYSESGFERRATTCIDPACTGLRAMPPGKRTPARIVGRDPTPDAGGKRGE